MIFCNMEYKFKKEEVPQKDGGERCASQTGSTISTSKLAAAQCTPYLGLHQSFVLGKRHESDRHDERRSRH